MIGRGYYGVNRLSYQCSQRGWLAGWLASAGGCWRALRHGAIYKPPGGTCPRL